MKAEDRLIVALDVPTLEAMKKLLEELRGVVSYYKVGLELFTAHGWEAVRLIHEAGGRIFLDLKLHDIPNTVAKTVRVLCEHPVDIINVHALGGVTMMKEARRAADEKKGDKKLKLLAVTILTSHSEAEMNHEIGIARKLSDQVVTLAKFAQTARLDGVVCSPWEIAMLRKELPADFHIITPGIRPKGSDRHDQKRAMTPQEAIRAGADQIVVGRPITQAAKPRAVAESILAEI